MAEVRIAVDERDIEVLRDWLRNEPELRGCVSMGSVPAPDGAMGMPTELVVGLVTSAGTVATVLAGTLSRWLIERERQRRCDVSIKVTGPDGRQVLVSAQRVPNPEPILRAVLETSAPDSIAPATLEAHQDR